MPLLIDNKVVEGPLSVAALLEWRIGRAWAARQRALAGGSLDSDEYLEWLNVCYAEGHGIPTRGELFMEWMIYDEI